MVFSLVLTDEQDDDGEASRGHWQGAAPPASRPPVTERPKRQTAAEWLDEIAMELANAPDGVALDAIQDSPKYQRMKAWLPNDGMDRLIHMEQQAIERVNAAETTAPNDEVHAGTFADPDSDPFAERVTA
jgi:hypothetical protein